jgi:hypothetical protein
MKERFQDAGRQNLIDALKRQEFVAGDAELAKAFAVRGELVEFTKGDKSSRREAKTTTAISYWRDLFRASSKGTSIGRAARAACRRDGSNRTSSATIR